MRHTSITRVAFAFVPAVIALVGALGTHALAAPMRVDLVPLVATGDVQLYRVTIVPGTDSLAIDIPADAAEADLLVDGVVTRRVGRNVPIAAGPLGHAATSLSLEGTAGARDVELRIRGTHGVPAIVNLRQTEIAFRNGYLGGMYLAILAMVVLFNIVSFAGTRDAATAWYLAFLTFAITAHVIREGFVLAGSPHASALVLVVAACAMVALAGFTMSFLELWQQSRRVVTIALLAMTAPMVVAATIEFLTGRQVSDLMLALPIFATVVSLVIVTIWRRLRGFRPASFLLIATTGIIAGLVAKGFREFYHVPSPFLDRFGFEIGMAFDAIVCTVGIVYRGQYRNRAVARIASELVGATYDAHHDPLTQLLNRRGLDVEMQGRMRTGGTVLFIDIDGFKRINDVGGHAAGDAALQEIGRELTHAARGSGIVARVGGDEFVIVFPEVPRDDLEVRQIASKVRGAVASIEPSGCVGVRIDASIGHGSFGMANDFFGALEEADRDAYRIKARRRAVER